MYKRQLQQLIIYTAADLPDMAHNQQLLTFAEYAYAAPNRKLQICSEGEKKPRIFPNIFTESRKLPEAARSEAAEDKEISNLIKHQVYDIAPITVVPVGSKLIGSRCLDKITVDDTYRARAVLLGWAMVAGIHCGSTFAPDARRQTRTELTR